MSVTFSEFIERATLSLGHPLLPIGYWLGHLRSTGDATAGTHTQTLYFRAQATRALPKVVVSLEWLNLVFESEAFAQTVKLTAAGFFPLLGGDLTGSKSSVALIRGETLLGVAGRTVLRWANTPALGFPILIMRPLYDDSTTVDASLSVDWSSNNNLLVYNFDCGGWLWDAASIKLGWPLRPDEAPTLIASERLSAELDRLRLPR